MNIKTVLILGGYGNFGKRISEYLSKLPAIKVLISGRSLAKAQSLASLLQKQSTTEITAIQLDIFSTSFREQLEKLSPDIVIHTCGPFQNQDYSIPKACIEIGAHYIDLSDDRKFTCNISSLDDAAKKNKLFIISGASSVPGLSSTVVEFYQSEFSSIDSIDIAIAPGNKAERGEATIRGILSYTGHPFKFFSDGNWKNTYGWMKPIFYDFKGRLGKRWLADIDVPDLTLFPERYQVRKRVSFKAGLELSVLHLAMFVMAGLARIRLVKNWSVLTKAIVKLSNLFLPFGTDTGGMQVLIKGKDLEGGDHSITWDLFADNGIGPYIPTISTNLLAKKIIEGKVTEFGAKPCLGMYTLSDFDEYIKNMDICTRVTIESADLAAKKSTKQGKNIG